MAQLAKNLPAMPIEVVRIDASFRFRIVKNDGVIVFRSSGRIKGYFAAIEVCEIRERFFAVETSRQLLDLLMLAQMPLVDARIDEFTWMTFIRLQGLLQREREEFSHFSRRNRTGVAEMRADPILPDVLFEQFEIDLRLDSTSKGRSNLSARMYCYSVIHAVRIANYIDELIGVEYAKCDWCERLFEITSKHKRNYCSNEHAHRAGQRRRRALKVG